MKRGEEHQKILLAELQHRVRNTLAVVRSIARRTAESSHTADEMLSHFLGRLDAFSRVQAAVTRNPTGGLSLRSLIDDELVAHAAHEGDQLRISGPEVSLEPKIAERLSLAIHELTTNAVKHGALINSDGCLRISWEIETFDAARVLVLKWLETGVTIDPAEVKDDGFGMELLRRSLPYDLQSETVVELTPTGLGFELRMPLSQQPAA